LAGGHIRRTGKQFASRDSPCFASREPFSINHGRRFVLKKKSQSDECSTNISLFTESQRDISSGGFAIEKWN
jgi:hypothetical protein